MIITKEKSFDTIIESLQSVGAKTVYLVGCGECATVVGTGGEEEMKRMVERLTSAGFVVKGSFIGEPTCHVTHVAVELRKGKAREADAVVVLACGSGVQAVADAIPSTPVFPGLDSLFIGNVKRRGEFEERCQTCGACGIGALGGICPLTTCPKGLLNGPCGGMWNGMCEIVNDRACAHVRIQERLREQGRVAPTVIDPKDHSTKSRGDLYKAPARANCDANQSVDEAEE